MQQRRAIAARMRRQDGLIVTEECRAAGVDDQTLSRAVANGELARPRRRVYAPPGAPPSFRRDLLADIRSCEREAHAAGSSALEVMRTRPSWLPLRREILVAGSSKPLIRGGVNVHRTRSLATVDTWLFEGVPSTTAGRALIDLVPQLSPMRQLDLLDVVACSPVCDIGLLHARATHLRNGRAGVGAIADLTGPGGEARFRSGLERTGLPLLRAAGVRDPQVNVVPRDAPGAGLTDVVSEPDRLIVDWDGLRFHAGPKARQRDNDKGNAAALGGYRHLRFTYSDVFSRPAHVTATAAAAVKAQRR